VGVVRAVAQVDDPASKGLAGAVEGAPGKAGLGGGADCVGGLDGFTGVGEELEEPIRAELEVGGLGQGLDELGVTQGRDGRVLALKDEAKGRGMTAEVGLDDLEAARAVEGGLGAGGRCRSGGRIGGRYEGGEGRGADPTESHDGASGGAEVG
jgi:hypothetical protein